MIIPWQEHVNWDQIEAAELLREGYALYYLTCSFIDGIRILDSGSSNYFQTDTQNTVTHCSIRIEISAAHTSTESFRLSINLRSCDNKNSQIITCCFLRALTRSSHSSVPDWRIVGGS
jgi:hypothetical protein